MDLSRTDELTVRGGRPLRGRLRVGGSKNAALPLLAATLAADGPTTLRRVPRLTDTARMADLLRGLGAAVVLGGGTVTVDPAGVFGGGEPVRPDPDHVGAMRGAVCLLGPLLASFSQRGGGAVRLALVGGCDLGPRPIDRHLAALAELGAKVERDDGGVRVSVARLRGAAVTLAAPPAPGLPPVPTVTGTTNLLCAAAVAAGVTTLRGAAREPEVVAVGRLLQSFGAEIGGLGTDTIRVEGVASLTAAPADAAAAVVPPDRIEAATWMIAAAATGGRVVLDDVDPAEVAAVAAVLRAHGATVETCGPAGSRRIRVIAATRPRAFEATSAAHPGLPTDALPQLAALALMSEGVSVLRDGVFPLRTAHLPALAQFGGVVERAGDRAVLTGGPLGPAAATAPNLRAAAALLTAALAAPGTSRVREAGVLRRGYERLVPKLRSLGADAAWAAPAASDDAGGIDRWRSPSAGRILAPSRPAPVPEVLPCPAA